MPYIDLEKRREASRAHYRLNKADYDERQRQARQRTRDYIENIKKRSQCKRCKNKDWRVLEFHHRDPEAKEASIATKVIGNKWLPARIDVELAKCDVVCANCHKIIHWEWRQAGKEVED